MTTRSKKKLKKKIEAITKERNKYFNFYNSVGCIIAEASEFMTKFDMYKWIKEEWHKVK